MKYTLTILVFFVNVYFYCLAQNVKINGASLVSSPSPINQSQLAGVKKVNANWVALIPYSFIKSNSTRVVFNTNFQWWGERLKGSELVIKYAKNENLKVFLKPHVWVAGQGWAGDFTLTSETDWIQWEQSYTNYIMAYAKLAQQYKVSLFCIGTELRQVVKERPLFWKKLIQEIRTIYKGQLTYAANWDNFHNVTFWDELDFIGIDSYFPLSEEQTPNIKNLNNAWKPIKTNLKNLSKYYKKPILFTEYGYTSSDYCTKESWSNTTNYPANELAQANAFQSVFETFWSEDWFAGGFFWKWHTVDKTKHNYKTNFTPQNKLASKVISKWYRKKSFFEY